MRRRYSERVGYGSTSAPRRFRPSLRVSAITSGESCSPASRPTMVAPRIRSEQLSPLGMALTDRKSTRLNSSHLAISYAVFCLKKNTVNNHLQALSWSMLRLHGGFVLPRHLGDGRPVFACEGFEQRCLRYPVQRVEPAHILSQEIVLHYPWVLRLILGFECCNHSPVSSRPVVPVFRLACTVHIFVQ